MVQYHIHMLSGTFSMSIFRQRPFTRHTIFNLLNIQHLTKLYCALLSVYFEKYGAFMYLKPVPPPVDLIGGYNNDKSFLIVLLG
jgi:hypothetical protein